jgi:hypothetical protein
MMTRVCGRQESVSWLQHTSHAPGAVTDGSLVSPRSASIIPRHFRVCNMLISCRSAIERMRLENEALKAELHLEQRESKMLESDFAKDRLSAIEKESNLLLRKVEDLRRQEFVRCCGIRLR